MGRQSAAIALARARFGDAASIPIVLPLRDGNGQFDGIIVTAFDLDWLGEQLRTRTLLEGDSITVADRDGMIVAREPLPEQFVGTRIPKDFLNLVEARRPGTIETISQDGARRILGYYPPAYTGTGLYVSYGVSRDLAFASINAATIQSVAIAVAAAIALFLIAWLVGIRLFRRPIVRMLATVEAWRHGNETARTGVPGGQGELALLAKAIDDYMDEVVADRAARTHAEQHRDLLVRELEHRVKNML